MLWGYGPAVDILAEIADVKPVTSQEELNILIIGASDGRHILQTIAKYYTHPRRKVNFYVTEVLLEMVARQLLLFLTALEPPDKLGLFEKTRLFMEIYGNTLVRPNTSKYLVKKAYQLVYMITDESYLARRLPLVSTCNLKYKERDNLETIFQFWAKVRFDNVIKLWDGRIRQSLGTRYDNKEGVFDWDYYMRLKEIPEGSRINVREYKHWRGTGVAFTWLETEVSEPNPSLASGIVKLGDRLLNHGYLGDIVSPPYLAFGTDSEDESLLTIRNGVNVHRSTDIVESNVRRTLYEIEHQQPYTTTHTQTQTQSEQRELGVVITELPDLQEVPSCETQVAEEYGDVKRKEEYSSLEVKDTKIIFLPTSALTELHRKPTIKNFFDVVFISQNLTQKLSPEVINIAKNEAPRLAQTEFITSCSAMAKQDFVVGHLRQVMSMAKNGAVLLAETRKFITSCSSKEKQDFVDHLRQLGEDRECRLLTPTDPVNDYLAKFQVDRKD